MNVSVVVPLYNEAESLPELCGWIDDVLSEHRLSYEVILVDDGLASGSTMEAAVRLAGAYPEIVTAISVGNEADIQFHEYLDFLQNDPDTLAILMYVEGMRDGYIPGESAVVFSNKPGASGPPQAAAAGVLTEALISSEVPHRWEGATVVVASDAEHAVDDLLDVLHSPRGPHGLHIQFSSKLNTSHAHMSAG